MARQKVNPTQIYNPYTFMVYVGSNVSSFGQSAKIPFNTVAFDPKGMFNTSNNRLTIQVAGQYSISWTVRIGMPSTNSYVQSTLRVNGTDVVYSGFGFFNLASGTFGSGGSTVLSLSVGDYIEIYNGSSGTGDLQAANKSTQLAGFLVNAT